MTDPQMAYLAKQLAGDAPRTQGDHEQFARWMRNAPNVEHAITALCQIREAAAAMGMRDPGPDIASWAQDALKSLGYER